jgi:hypothetical protein
MNGGIEQPLPSTLRDLSIARVLFDVRNEPRVEDRFAIMLESKPPSRLRYEPPIRKSVSLAMRFNAFNPSGRSTVSASLTGATGSGARTKPLLSIIVRIFWFCRKYF